MNTVLIVEDEPNTKQFIEAFVGKHPLVDRTFAADNSKDAVESAKMNLPSIALLDIELSPEDPYNGIQVARIIKKVSPRTVMIFLTGYNRYALDSFDVHPYHYLLKPIDKGKLTEVITEISSKQFRGDNKVAMRAKDGTVLLDTGDIAFIEKKERKVIVYSKQNEFEISSTLGELEAILPGNFIRVHNSFIVNLASVLMIKPTSSRNYQITFNNCNKIAWMSREKYDKNKQYFL